MLPNINLTITEREEMLVNAIPYLMTPHHDSSHARSHT